MNIRAGLVGRGTAKANRIRGLFWIWGQRANSPSGSSISQKDAEVREPHLVKIFEVSRDPKFVEKLENIFGLYMSLPGHVLVLISHEKSQVQDWTVRNLDCLLRSDVRRPP